MFFIATGSTAEFKQAFQPIYWHLFYVAKEYLAPLDQRANRGLITGNMWVRSIRKSIKIGIKELDQRVENSRLVIN